MAGIHQGRFKMITRRNFLASTAAAIPAVSYLSMAQQAFADTPKNLLVVAQQLDNMTTLDPHVSFEATGSEIIGNMYQQLVSPNLENPDVVDPDVAESWEASDDDKTFTFKIRDGIKFSSGNELTAEDAAWSLRRTIKLNKSPAFIISQFGFTPENVEEMIQATDPRTLVIKTAEPTSIGFLVYCLSANIGCVADKQTVMENEVDGDMGSAWLDKNSAGSATFMLNTWRPSDTVVLTVNPHAGYEGPLERVMLRHIVDPSSQMLMLTKGDIDIARNLTTEQLESVKSDDSIKLLRKQQASIMQLSMNVSHEKLSDPKVWEAVKWAIDYQGIKNNILGDTYDVHQSFVPNGLPGALNDTIFTQDVEKAQSLLAEAGYPDGFEIELDHYSAQPYPDIAQAVQANLAEVGIKAKLISGENRQVLTKMRARQHQMIISAWGTDYFDPNANADPYIINKDNSDDAASKPFVWRSHFQDDELIALAEDARGEKDPAARIEKYLELQKKFVHASPFAIMFQKTATVAMRDNIDGVILAPLPSNNSYEEVTKT